jgi:hypothetical protein
MSTPKTPTQPQPANEERFADLLDSASGVQKPRASKPEAVKVEPTMRALRRILGEDVLDFFPIGIVDNTDRLYDLCAENADFWAEIKCESVAERNDLLALMRAYAECARTNGYTVRQDRTAGDTVLRCRVIPRKGSGNADSEGESS